MHKVFIYIFQDSAENVNIKFQSSSKTLNNLVNDIIIVSGDKEEIPANKMILSIFSPNLCNLFSDPYFISTILLIPDCSSISIKHLLSIITTGFTMINQVSFKVSNDIIETAKVLSINLNDFIVETVDKTNSQKEQFIESMDLGIDDELELFENVNFDGIYEEEIKVSDPFIENCETDETFQNIKTVSNNPHVNYDELENSRKLQKPFNWSEDQTYRMIQEISKGTTPKAILRIFRKAELFEDGKEPTIAQISNKIRACQNTMKKIMYDSNINTDSSKIKEILVSSNKARIDFGIGNAYQKNIPSVTKGKRRYFSLETVEKMSLELEAKVVDPQKISNRVLVRAFPQFKENIKNISFVKGFKKGVAGRRSFYFDVEDINREFQTLDPPITLLNDTLYISEEQVVRIFEANKNEIKDIESRIYGKTVNNGKIVGNLSMYYHIDDIHSLFHERATTTSN